MRRQNGNTQYVLVAAEPLKQIIQIFTIQRLASAGAKSGAGFATAKIVTLFAFRCMRLLDEAAIAAEKSSMFVH